MKRARSNDTQAEILPREFYHQDTLTASRELIGKVLIHTLPDGSEIACIISETEAYNQDEPSCHAYKGKKTANRAMFYEGGHIYIYHIHSCKCINFVTEHEGRGCAVLLRGVTPLRGTEFLAATHKKPQKLLDGPGKLVKNMRIPIDYYGMDLLDPLCPLKIADEGFKPVDMKVTPRIGIKLAAELPWRFVATEFSKNPKRLNFGKKEPVSKKD